MVCVVGLVHQRRTDIDSALRQRPRTRSAVALGIVVLATVAVSLLCSSAARTVRNAFLLQSGLQRRSAVAAAGAAAAVVLGQERWASEAGAVEEIIFKKKQPEPKIILGVPGDVNDVQGAAPKAPAVDRFPDFTTTPSGLRYKVLQNGTGDQVQVGDLAMVNITGWQRGFPWAPARDDKPAFRYMPIKRYITDSDYSSMPDKNFYITLEQVGSSNVFPGWNEALKTMRVGEQRLLILPPELAYGNKGNALVAPKTTLYFNMKVLQVEAPPAPVEPNLGVPNFGAVLGALGQIAQEQVSSALGGGGAPAQATKTAEEVAQVAKTAEEVAKR